MWFNIIKIARRKLWRKKGNTFIKIFSLAIGIVSLFYIAIYIHQELGFDSFHTNRSHIQRVNTTIISPTGDIELGLSAIPVGEYLKDVAPGVTDFVRINQEFGSHAIKNGANLFSEAENILYADPSFLNIFDFELLYGNRESALQGPDKIMITAGAALKYFGTTDALGKVLTYDGEPLTVSGVFEDLPANSQLQFNFLLPMEIFMNSRPPDVDQNWTWFPMNTYVLLDRSATAGMVSAKLKEIPQYLPENNPGDNYELSLEPLEGIHFSTPKLGELGSKGKLANLYVLFAIGVMILLLAVTNFINLTTAQVSVQGKEVSIKKTVGASKVDIFKQFFLESLLLTTLATLISIGGIALSFTYFEQFMGTSYDLSFMFDPVAIILFPLIPVIISLLGGIYPAIRFSRIRSIPASSGGVGPNRFWNTRTALVVLQFTITSALVIGSLIIYTQLDFIRSRDLGMDTAQKIVVDYGPNAAIGTAFKSLKQEFAGLPGVTGVTFSSHVPGQMPNGVATQIRDLEGRSSHGEINLNLVDPDFVGNYGLKIIAGRDFRNGSADETASLILNKAAVKAFGYTNPEAILGASFEQWGGNGTVIGVVEDFNYMSLHEDVGLLSLKVWPEQFTKMTLEVTATDFKETLDQLQGKWSVLYPDIPFNYYFVDDNFRAQYNKDQQFATIINIFTLIAICIGVLGLIAYANFWCERRRKEMSIRKVLGAGELRLVWKLYKGFSIPVLTGFAVAVPVAVFFGRRWLTEFAYSFELNWHFFAVPLLVLLVLVWIAVGSQTISLVLANPVDHLKEE